MSGCPALSTRSVNSTVRLELRPSRWFLRLVVASHALALLACWLNSLALGWRLVAMAGVGLSLLHVFKQHCRNAQGVELLCSDAGWALRGKDGVTPIALQGSTLNVPWLVILHYRVPTKRGVQTLPVYADAIDAEQFRQLRVALRIAELP